MKFSFFFLLLALFVASCTPKGAAAVNNADDQLSGTIDAVQSAGGDITALPAGAAVANIDGWVSKLNTMDGTDGIVRDLTSLKSELGMGSIDGSKVAVLLSSLATSTRSLEAKAPGLSTLASALQAGADKLGGR